MAALTRHVALPAHHVATPLPATWFTAPPAQREGARLTAPVLPPLLTSSEDSTSPGCQRPGGSVTELAELCGCGVDSKQFSAKVLQPPAQFLQGWRCLSPVLSPSKLYHWLLRCHVFSILLSLTSLLKIHLWSFSCSRGRSPRPVAQVLGILPFSTVGLA